MIKFKNYLEEADKAGKSIADKAKKSGISAKTLRNVPTEIPDFDALSARDLPALSASSR